MALVGFRFHPTEEELIGHYLARKQNGCDSLVDDHIGEIDHLYRWDPWDLPDFARKQSDDQEWYFFCRLDYKYSNSKRVNRTTKNGNWKLTGKIRDIKLRRTGEVIGTKKNLVFQYKCPDSKKVVGTSWVIHEFQAKNSPPDERALVLCKLKYKANDWAATSPNDEGEPSRVMGFDVENTAAQTNIREVDAEQLLPLIDSHVEDFNFPLPLQSQNHVQNCLSDEEYLNEFADSFLIDPDEHENPAQYLLLNDDSPQASSSKAYVEGSSDGATYAGYGVAEYGGHGSSKGYRQLQMAGGDDILLMGASSMGSTTGTRHEQIDLMQSVGEEFSSIHEPLPPPKYPRFIGGEKVYHQSLRAREGRREGANTVLPQKERFSTESEKGRKIVQVTKAKPNVNSRSIESAGNDRKGRFIHFEATTSSHRSSPRSVYFFNAVLGVVMFLIILREVLIVH